MQNLIQRSITGIFFVGILLVGLLTNMWAFFTIYLIGMIATLYEYLRLFKQDNKFHTTEYAIMVGGMILYAVFFVTHYADATPHLWYMLLFPALLYFGALVFRPVPNKHMLLKSSMGLIYIVMPFVLMQYLVFDNGEFNGILMLLVFIFIWANDSFAYLFGVSIGKHRIWPKVSPKKSWEGSIGGFSIVMLICVALWKFTNLDIAMLEWFGFGFVVVVSATLGDFFESYLKRMAGVKDSGNILPGHGGFYDRFDSTLFAVPTSVVYLQLVHII